MPHATNDDRDTFAALFDRPVSNLLQIETEVEGVPRNKIFGRLWNCNDVLPGSLYDSVVDVLEAVTGEEPKMMRTYAAASRRLKSALSDA